ncbi:MAG: NAD-dependent epimerase/dehydratase family protein [Alphaproteobacteria bacterium]
MRILLTGATGFLGQALLAAAPPEFAFVTLGRRPAPVARLDLVHIEADMGVPASLQSALESGRIAPPLDIVMHLAVSRFHRGFPDTALDMFNVNVASTATLLDFARRAGVRQFILGSTGTVYHPFENPICREDDALDPQSYFAFSKLAAERFALTYSPAHFGVFVPRFFTPYGPGQQDRLVSGLIDNVTAGRPVRLPPQGNGLSTAPLYLDDAVRVLLEAVAAGWQGVVNIAGPQVLTLAEMVHIVGRVVEREPVIERAPGALDAALVPDLERLSRYMSLDTFVTFQDGLARFVTRQ